MFKDNDVICFLGDSITAAGLWMGEVYQLLRKKYKIKCFNCGVAGGSARKAVQYLHCECLIRNPDYVSIMFGINDINRDLYDDELEGQEDLPQKKADAIKLCISKYAEIVDEIVKSGATPIICIPVPYDEVTVSDEKIYRCQCAMDELEIAFRALAEKYDCPVVDFKKAFMPKLGKEGIMNTDRVHPTPHGHHIMAQTFLCDLGEIDSPDYDSSFEFEDWNKKRYDAEQKLHCVNFVEYAGMFDAGWALGKTYEEKKQIAKERYDECEDKTTFIPTAYLDYIENIDNRSRMLGEIAKLTIF
ncbi:MAG: hypothetical protein II998_07845 [Clostridia bacterium]|nr:hypothetical protein [Clostridia bacterium]